MLLEKFIVIGAKGNLLEAIIGIPERDASFPTTDFLYAWVYKYSKLCNVIFTNNPDARKPAKTALPNESIITQVDTVTRTWNNTNTNSEFFSCTVFVSSRLAVFVLSI